MRDIYKTAFENSFDGICIFDSEGKGIDINKSAERLTNFSRQEFIGLTADSAIKRGYVSKSLTETVLKKEIPVTEIISIKGVEVLATANPVFSKSGEISYFILNIRDISELNNLNLDVLLSIALKKRNKGVLLDKSSDHILPFSQYDNVISVSSNMKKIIKLAEKVAKVDSSVLILGESGVGKEVIVKIIHDNSHRKEYPFVKINCAALPPDLLESELFGYEKGAFTGANELGKLGLFETGNGGTIFLDEIGDMSLDLQAKLLRVLQEYEIRRIGGRKDIKIDVRIISATNKDLKELIKTGDFREDLYYRLNIVPIKIPPLRDRLEDIQHLAHLFLNKTNQKYKLEKYFQPGLTELLHQYDWPGNIREMENMIERLVVTAEQNEISWSDLPFIVDNPNLSENYSLKSTLEEVERKIITEKIQTFRTTRRTAKALGISQSSIVNKMRKYNIVLED